MTRARSLQGRVGWRLPAPAALLLAAVLSGGCAPSARGAAQEAADAARHSAALAHVVVDNRAGSDVDVAYRPAVGPGGQVGIGRVLAGTRAELAPVPAGEPLRFLVRGAPVGDILLPPISLDVDARRLLVVAPDTAWWEG